MFEAVRSFVGDIIASFENVLEGFRVCKCLKVRVSEGQDRRHSKPKMTVPRNPLKAHLMLLAEATQNEKGAVQAESKSERTWERALASHSSDVRPLIESRLGKQSDTPGTGFQPVFPDSGSSVSRGCEVPDGLPGFRGKRVAAVRGSRQSPRISGRAHRGGAGFQTVFPDSRESAPRRCGIP